MRRQTVIVLFGFQLFAIVVLAVHGDLRSVLIKRTRFHEEWNYEIHPHKKAATNCLTRPKSVL